MPTSAPAMTRIGSLIDLAVIAEPPAIAGPTAGLDTNRQMAYLAKCDRTGRTWGTAYSITSSAVASSIEGTVRPSIRAV
jgi:hypothetical protein